MDCRGAPSYAITPEGQVLLDTASPESCIHFVEYPLERHRFPSRLREEMIATRRPWDYDAIALDGNGLDEFPAVWGLPPAGPIAIRCIVPPPQLFVFRNLLSEALAGTEEVPTIVVLPPGAGYMPVQELVGLVGERAAALVAETAALFRAAGARFYYREKPHHARPRYERDNGRFRARRIALAQSRGVETPGTGGSPLEAGMRPYRFTGGPP